MTALRIRHSLPPGAIASLFGAIQALRNRRALAALVCGLAAGMAVAVVGSWLAALTGWVMAFVGACGMFVGAAAGFNAAGVLLQDQARGRPARTLGAALLEGLRCVPRTLLLALALLAVALAAAAVLALAYALCRIPVLGQLLFVLVFPASILIAGCGLWGLLLGLLLAMPEIWAGAGVLQALRHASMLARRRPLEATLMLVIVWLLALLVGALVFGVLFTGLMPAVVMAAAFLGGDGLSSLLEMLRSPEGMGGLRGGAVALGGAGYAVAAGMGAALLWALAGSLLALVHLLGLNLVHLRVVESLEWTADDAAPQVSASSPNPAAGHAPA